MTGRRRPQWTSRHEIVLSTPIARLRDFSQGATDDVVPTLVLPPQAGHDSCIVDFSPAQSQLETIRAAGLTRTYSLNWIGATAATRGATIEDYVDVIDRAADVAGGRSTSSATARAAGSAPSTRPCGRSTSTR